MLEILEHEGLLALARERSLLSGMQLDRVGASIASFDLLYLPELRRRGCVAPCVDASRKEAQVRGGAVLDSMPGLFANVAVFDFKSLYPSLIRTFALDPLAHARAGADAIEAPNGARFAREGAILPEILERFMARRAAAKRRGDRHADQAIKIMMNALFGVLGAAGCRFFDPQHRERDHGFGQQTLLGRATPSRAAGVDVLYGDTDSVFVQLHAGRRGRARGGRVRLREQVEARIATRVRETLPRRAAPPPRARVHLRALLHAARARRPSGSKKRYAGLRDGALELVGLEAVRRDWPAVARRLQRGLLERVFADEDPLPLRARDRGGACARASSTPSSSTRGACARARSSRTSRPRRPTSRPRARRARRPARVIRYVIAATGPEPVQPGRPLPGPIDHAHYVERVLRPIAEQILEPLGHSFDEALGAPRQLALL